MLEFQDHTDYEVIQSTDPALHKAVVRVNNFRKHRQTIQYIAPSEHAVLAQAELLVVDEAAAIPLPTVKKLLGLVVCPTWAGGGGRGGGSGRTVSRTRPRRSPCTVGGSRVSCGA